MKSVLQERVSSPKKFGSVAFFAGVLWVCLASCTIHHHPERLAMFLGRNIDKIEGAPRCERRYRISLGESGNTLVRLYFVDDNNQGMVVDNGANFYPNLNVSEHLVVRPSSVVVLHAETGRRAQGVTALLRLEEGSSRSGWAQRNPQSATTYPDGDYIQTPRALSVLVDSSNASGIADPESSRFASIFGWSLSRLNSPLNTDEENALALMLVRKDQFSSQNNVFFDLEPSWQLLDPENQPHGFVLAGNWESDVVQNHVKKKWPIFPPLEGQAPLYETIYHAAQEVRKIGWSGLVMKRQPGIVVLSASQDVHTLSPERFPSFFDAAKKEIKGDGDRFVPLMSVVYPRPKDTTEEAWEEHVDRLCELAKEAHVEGSSENNYFGQVFQVHPNLELVKGEALEAQTAVRWQLDKAFHAMAGFFEVKVHYELIGAQKGNRYFIAFALDEKVFEQRKEPNNTSSFLVFEVRP